MLMYILLSTSFIWIKLGQSFSFPVFTYFVLSCLCQRGHLRLKLQIKAALIMLKSKRKFVFIEFTPIHSSNGNNNIVLSP
jgi:hypothetical protein